MLITLQKRLQHRRCCCREVEVKVRLWDQALKLYSYSYRMNCSSSSASVAVSVSVCSSAEPELAPILNRKTASSLSDVSSV
jgi:hypothetical protein